MTSTAVRPDPRRAEAPDAPAPIQPPAPGQVRIAYLTFGSGEYDARTFRMARSAIAAGYHVTVYARWYPGLPLTEDRDGYRLIRAPYDWQLAVPGLRGSARRRVAAAMAESLAQMAEEPEPEAERDGDDAGFRDRADAEEATLPVEDGRVSLAGRIARFPLRVARSLKRRARGRYKRWRRLLRFFPLWPLGWAAALQTVAQPADIWHGMWAGSLPASLRLRRRFGGRAIYDSRDVYMQSRDFAHAGWPGKAFLEWLERRWARDVDRVLTVNDAYAEVLAEQLQIPRPPVVMNCPERWVPPSPPPDRIRETLGLPPTTRIVLYQGGFMTGRGIEQSMEAILAVPDAALCLLGFGALRDGLVAQAAEPPYLGRVFVLDPVPPDSLLEWTASADVSVMAIQPTSLNHHFTTPQKLFESMAVGVPVVASDLPGMARLVRETDAGVVCDPTSPAAIAAGIRAVLDAPADEAATRRTRLLAAVHGRYDWEAQVDALFALYRELAPASTTAGPSAQGRDVRRS